MFSFRLLALVLGSLAKLFFANGTVGW